MRGLFGAGGGYQGAESAEETRRREARERAEAEHWARVEAREDEAREERRSREEHDAARGAKKERKRAARAKAKTTSAASDAKWADFDERWAALESAPAGSGKTPLTYDQIPWPPRMTETLARAAKGAARDTREFKAAYRASLLRWHPDKFAARHAGRLRETDRERILARVNAVARAINVAFGKG